MQSSATGHGINVGNPIAASQRKNPTSALGMAQNNFVGAPVPGSNGSMQQLSNGTLSMNNAPSAGAVTGSNAAPVSTQQNLNVLQQQQRVQQYQTQQQQQQRYQQVEILRQTQQQQQQPTSQQQQQMLQQQQMQMHQQQNSQHQQQQTQTQHHQQAPQQQQQRLNHPGLIGGWQSDNDVQARRSMIEKIVRLLQQRKPNAPPDWLQKLPQMAKRLEESLYKNAPSFQAYNDESSLKHRLQQLALNIGKNKQNKLQQLQKQQQQQQQQKQQYVPTINSNSIMPQIQQQPHQNQMTMQQSQMRPSISQQPQRQMVNMSDINPNAIMNTQQVIAPQSNPTSASDNGLTPNFNPQSNSMQNRINNQQMNGQRSALNQQIHCPKTMPMSSATAQTSTSVGPGNGNSGTNTGPTNGESRSGSDRQQVLRHQQQRLLLLRHAAKCPHEDGRCPVTPHCAGMKRLWKHIAECKDQKCLVPHCVSSRYVLSHYHRCKDVRCPVCGPVREAIHRSHEKAKQQQMKALKHRHEQALQQNQMTPSNPTVTPSQQISLQQNTRQQMPQMQQQSQQQQLQNEQQQRQLQQQQQQRQLQQQQPQKAQQVLQQPVSQVPQKISQLQQPQQPQHQVHPGVAPSLIVNSSVQGRSSNITNSTSYPSQVSRPQKRNKKNAMIPSIPMAPGQQASQVPSSSTQQLQTNQQSHNYLPQQPLLINSASVPNQAKPGLITSQVPIVGPTPSQVTSAGGAIYSGLKAGPKPQEDHTLINCFTIEQIETHISSLNNGLQLPAQKVKVKCLDVLKILQSHQHGWVFNNPVDPVELGLPDYFQVIKKPMDLGTIKKRLENGCYHSMEDFEADVHLTFDNAMLYNQEGSVVHNMAKEMKEKFISDYAIVIEQLNAEEDQKRKNGDACALCGCEKLLFEPPVFYCNGVNCPSKRIRRNSYYYVGGNNQYHWCHQCYGELKESQSIEIGEVTMKKQELLKKKNDEVHEESWVQCDKCERWIHQICGLFNTRQNKDQRSEFACPSCTIEERKKKGVIDGTSTTPMAEDLPRTKLSEWLEKEVRVKVEKKIESMAREKSDREGISFDAAMKLVKTGGDVTIRQVTSMTRTLEVRERMKRRYAFKNYPSEFSFRCKCIIVFQNLDGVDVILFGLYVYEHDENNPSPNKRAVYISYLDSVHYMRPRSIRTFVYHEILIAYLDYVRRKGFETAHIWACPPLKGDDYILYAKPEDQKTPKDDRLRQWYLDMLVESQRRGVVGKLTNMYDLYFAHEKNDATVVPYMDGDYFPAEVENIIKDIEEGKGSKKSSSSTKKKSKKNQKAKSKAKSGRGGTRSTGIDEEALAASGMIPPGVEQKSLEEGGRDYVMVKLGETIHPMKESFIVAYLQWDGLSEENSVVPKEIEDYRRKYGIVVKPKKKEFNSITPSDKSSLEENETTQTKVAETISSAPGTISNTGTSSSSGLTTAKDNKHDFHSKSSNNGSNSETTNTKENCELGSDESKLKIPDNVISTNADMNEKDGVSNVDNSQASSTSLSNTAGPVPLVTSSASSDTPVHRDGKLSAMARKRDAEGKMKKNSKSSANGQVVYCQATVKDSKGRSVKVIDDDLEEMDSDFLNNRQLFLNLCQGNHYQFDQVRRAKHTSMMVLWHLHNRDAPKFVQQCAVCSREILTGHRYHCPTCTDYDQCQECANNPNTPRHPHQLKPIPIASAQQNDFTDAERKERQRVIQLHMQLLLHAATCASSSCPSANCNKMKGLLKHAAHCKVKATGGCHVCKRIWGLLQIHARQCKEGACRVPNCISIRERYRQLTKQQQAMDDRRRQEMNRTYRALAR